MKLVIGGDVVPTQDNIELFCKADIESLMGKDLEEYWFSCDYRIINLECAATDSTERIMKNGPSLVVKKECLNGIKSMNPSLLLLSNNHILDAGEMGLRDLIDRLQTEKIPYIGVGECIDRINPSYIVEYGGVKVGIYVCCDYEFSVAGNDKAGANPFSQQSYELVKNLAGIADYVIVIYHGGKEYYRYPSPDLQIKCRAFVDVGAKLVVCQHSHCIGAEEDYKHGKILYGQGNFIFNKKQDEFWHTSLLVEVEAGKEFSVKYVPLVQTEKGTSLASDEEAREILSNLYGRSEKIREPGFIENEFSKFSSSIITSYLYTFAGWNPCWSALDRKVFHNYFIKRHFSKKQLAAIWNFITTDAHREVLQDALKSYLNKP